MCVLQTLRGPTFLLLLLLLLLAVVVVPLQRVLQPGGDLLEEADLLTEVVLHLQAEVPYPRAVEVLDLGQRGAGDDVAALVELALLLGTVLHLGQCTWRRRSGEKNENLIHTSGNLLQRSPRDRIIFNRGHKCSEMFMFVLLLLLVGVMMKELMKVTRPGMCVTL